MSQVYYLSVSSDSDTTKQAITDSITLGSSEDCDIVLKAPGVKRNHLKFRLQNNVLSVINLAEDGQCKIEDQNLNSGKMYIIDEGDQLIIGEGVEISVEKEMLHQRDDVQTWSPESTSPEPHRETTVDELNEIIGGDEDEFTLSRIEDLESTRSVHQKAPELSESGDISLDDHAEQEDRASEIQDFVELKKDNLQEEESIQAEEPIDEESQLHVMNANEFIHNQEVAQPTNQEASKVNLSIEDEAKNQTRTRTLITKLAELRKRSNRQKISIKKPKVKKISVPVDYDLPAFIVRLMAYSFQCLFLFVLYTQTTWLDPIKGLSLEIVETGLEKAQFILSTIIPELDLQLKEHSLWFVLYLYITIIDIFSHLIFGVSFGLKMVGVVENSSFITSRLKGFIRSLIGALTTPFIIFDLPLVFKRRSLKEVLTLSHLDYNRFTLKLLALPILMGLIMTSLMLPLLQDLNHFLHPDFSIVTQKRSSKQQVNKQQDSIVASPLLKMTFQHTDSLDILNLPILEIGKSNHIQSFELYSIDLKSKAKIIYSYQNHFAIDSWLNSLRPVPILSRFPQQLQSANVPKMQKQKLLRNLLVDIFSLSLQTLPIQLLNNGPFLGSLSLLRQDIFRRLQIPQNATTALVTLGHHEFIHIHATELNYLLYADGDQIFFHKILSDPKALKLKNQFVNSQLFKANPFFQEETSLSLSPYHLLDLAYKLDQSQGVSDRERDLLGSILKRQGAKVLGSGNDSLYKLMEKSIRSFRTFLSQKQQQKNDYYIQEMLQEVDSIQKQFKMRNSSFFNINL